MSRLRLLALVALAAWVGIAAFFSFAAAPLLFAVLEREAAGRVVGALLPSYYRWGIALGVVAALALAVSARRAAGRGALLGAGLAAAMTALLLWSALATLPATEQARRRGDRAAFARAHGTAVALNLAAMACGAAVLVVELLTRRRPGGAGARAGP